MENSLRRLNRRFMARLRVLGFFKGAAKGENMTSHNEASVIHEHNIEEHLDRHFETILADDVEQVISRKMEEAGLAD